MRCLPCLSSSHQLVEQGGALVCAKLLLDRTEARMTHLGSPEIVSMKELSKKRLPCPSLRF